MGAEGNYAPTNPFNHEFVNTKLMCQLIPVQRDVEFTATRSDFNVIVANIRNVEKLIPQKRGHSASSCIREMDGQTCICLSHALFIVRPLFLTCYEYH